uniref:Protein kinase domain-containing protein n=1 Tax=Rhizophagus irregularis (strain DAOM 181602 / DAOM 197198 / MUCL 43194) TaxID=747089 RepID=U9UV27_RHIID
MFNHIYIEYFEWIPYNNLENIKYLTKGGFSEIYTADWIDGWYEEWDSEEQLVRFGTHDVIFKNVENASQRWFEEAKSHLTISSKYPNVIQCYGLCVAMLMWEILFGQPPFLNYEKDCNLAINIINGMRPKSYQKFL